MSRTAPVAALLALTLAAGCGEPFPGGDTGASATTPAWGATTTDDCAPPPHGAGAWRDVDGNDIHCNYLMGEEWAYGLNSTETACRVATWAPPQSRGHIEMWEWNGRRGCDWVITW